MIEARDLTKNYGAVRALRGIDFQIESGEVVGLLGPNGAGKSTAMRITTGFLSPTSGSVTVGGIEVLDDPHAVQTQIGYLPEGNPLYLDMRLREALRFTAAARGLTGDERRRAIGAALDDAGLLGREHQIIASFSRGFRQRVGLATALLHRPPILILDEPTSGLDPNQQTEMRKFVRSLAEAHTIVFSSHILPEVEAVCDRVIAIHKGQVVADGTVEEVRTQATGGATVGMIVRGAPEAARAAFEGLPFGSVEACERDAQDTGLVHVRLSTGGEEGIAAREAMSKAAYEAGLGLVHLAVERASLEDAFAVLTPDDADDIGPASDHVTMDDLHPQDSEQPDDSANEQKGDDDVA
ncbi:MAG: ATP-binding cassette domain-containing protein [Planctomycetota bacterium]|nr:ATP-binding cassette domain-containing protein [Planctomycetota bacterium]